MKFTVNFLYQATFKPYRAVKSRAAYFQSSGEIDVPEVDRSAVRPVIRVGTLAAGRDTEIPRWSFDDAFCAKPDGSMREIVDLNGKLFIESISVEEAVASLGKDGLNIGLFAGLGLSRRASEQDIATSRAQLERNHATPFREFKDDAGAGVRQALERRARAFLLIDGTIYVRCHEPILYIDHKFGKSSIKFADNDLKHQTSSTRAGNYGYAWDDADAHYFNLHEYGIGLTELKLRCPREEIRKIAAFEVIDPTAIKATPHVMAISKLARTALSQLWSNPLSLLPDAAECAVKLRDALSDVNNQVTPHLLRALEDVTLLPELSPQQLESWKRLAEARPLRPAWPGHREDNGRSDDSRATEIVKHQEHRTNAVKAAKEALRRYAQRPAGMTWEDRAFDVNIVRDAETRLCSIELLSPEPVKAAAARLKVDIAPHLDEVNDGGRFFAIQKRVGSVEEPCALILARPLDGTLRAVNGKPEHRALIDRHIALALQVQPHLAPGVEPLATMEMIR